MDSRIFGLKEGEEPRPTFLGVLYLVLVILMLAALVRSCSGNKGYDYNPEAYQKCLSVAQTPEEQALCTSAIERP